MIDSYKRTIYMIWYNMIRRCENKKCKAYEKYGAKGVKVGVSPNGEIFEFFNQSKFSKEHNLRQSTIADCLSGKCKTHKGWKFYLK